MDIHKKAWVDKTSKRCSIAKQKQERKDPQPRVIKEKSNTTPEKTQSSIRAPFPKDK